MHKALSLLTTTLFAFSPVAAPAAEPEVAPASIKAAIGKCLPLLERSTAEYRENRQCFSCHHQALPLLAATTAQVRGFDVSAQWVRAQVQHTSDAMVERLEDYRKGSDRGGRVDTPGYALLALDLGGVKPNATTTTMVDYLLLMDKDLDYWRVSGKRPPSEYTSFTTTYYALRGLRKYATPEQQERARAKIARVRRWLLATPARETEERVFRLWSLRLVDAAEKDIQAAAQELLQAQRPDGGWSQTEQLTSDAYATGSVLVALHQAGGLSVKDPIYQRGLKFLLAGQLADGSWRVRTRSKPVQTYFETGFPHGKDQFISMAASSWATTALALAYPVEAEVIKAPTASNPAGD